METFAQAQYRIFRDLQDLGWSGSNPALKIRHVTSPDGLTRLWLKPQAIYFTHGQHSFDQGRSLHVDPRRVTAVQVIRFVGVYVEESKVSNPAT